MALATFVSGCQETNPAANLRRAGVGGPPDEFLVLPTRPLEIPQNLAALPSPAPGTTNRVDARPREEAVAGLTGGSGQLATTSGAALVASSPPAAPQIRARLAVEDVTYRQEHRGLFLERLFANDQDALIYRAESLNAPNTYLALRSAGVSGPTPPPSVMTVTPYPEPQQDPAFRAYRPIPPGLLPE